MPDMSGSFLSRALLKALLCWLLTVCRLELNPLDHIADVSAVANPFSTTAFLPLVAGLDRLVERLVVSLVKYVFDHHILTEHLF